MGDAHSLELKVFKNVDAWQQRDLVVENREPLTTRNPMHWPQPMSVSLFRIGEGNDFAQPAPTGLRKELISLETCLDRLRWNKNGRAGEPIRQR